MITLPDSSRILLEAELVPAQGTRFQPTGFPDLGAATYELHDGTKMMLVESAQSVANRLEAACWDESRGDVVAELAGMPYVRVKRGDHTLTTSLQEAHRLNSVYIEKSDGFEALKAEIGDEEPFDRRRLAKALLKRDPNSLVHGIFLESIMGTARLPRAISGFIEARNVGVAASGGVKNDRVSAGTDEESDASKGFGNVPFHRDEYTAEAITAFFNVDVSQVRSLGLGDLAERFLVALSLWKVRRFLGAGLRLRTACDLEVRRVTIKKPAGWVLPEEAELAASLRELIPELARSGLFANPPITDVAYGGAAGKKKKAPKGKASEPAES